LARLKLDASTGTILTGYTTLQIPSDRTAQLQAAVGDTTVCWTLMTGLAVDAGASLADGGAVQTVPRLLPLTGTTEARHLTRRLFVGRPWLLPRLARAPRA
jgi:hypothetical protein